MAGPRIYHTSEVNQKGKQISLCVHPIWESKEDGADEPVAGQKYRHREKTCGTMGGGSLIEK